MKPIDHLDNWVESKTILLCVVDMLRAYKNLDKEFLYLKPRLNSLVVYLKNIQLFWR